MDNVLNAETWLFGEVGQAYYHQDDQYFKVSVRDETPTPCRAQEMNVLYDACMDAPIYLPYILPPEQLSEKLWEWYEKYSALEFFLDGLDATLDEELRINCIRDVEETFEENEEAYQFVRQRFLSRPLPNEADIKNAIKYAETRKVKQLYQKAEEKEKHLVTLNQGIENLSQRIKQLQCLQKISPQRGRVSTKPAMLTEQYIRKLRQRIEQLQQTRLAVLTNKTKSADKCSRQVKINIVDKGK